MSASSDAALVLLAFENTVRLADDKTLDITGVGDVVLKTSFGTSWTLKDVRIGMNMLASKGNVPDVRKVDIYFCKPGGLGKQMNLSFIMSEKTRKLQRLEQVHIEGVAVVRDCDAENGPAETPLQFSVVERLSRTIRAKSTGIRAEAPKMLWADSGSTTYLIYRIPYVMIKLHIPEEEWSATDSSSLTKPIQKSQVVLVDILENLVENDNIVAEHGLSLEITQSPGGSSDTSEGTEAPRLYRYKDPADSPGAPVRYSPSANYLLLTDNGELESYSEALIRISAGKKALQRLWMFKVKEEQNDRKRYKARFVVKGFQQKQRLDYNEIFSPVVKMTT
ncbi:retrovirus-related pol polyprotein from transposon TNT 1-94, partial [Tanacetum coccineum]